MSEKRIKIIAVIFGILALLFSIYFLNLYFSMFGVFGRFPVDMLKTNSFMQLLTLSPLCFFIAFVSSIGVFKIRQWGRYLAISALGIYLLIFFWVIVTQTFSTFFDNAFHAGHGWFIFYHMNLRIDTFVIPVISLAFLVLFKLKVFKNYFVR